MVMRVLQLQWWWRDSEWSPGIKATCCGLFGSLLLISALLCGDGYELNILVFTVNSFWSEDWNQLVIVFFSCVADIFWFPEFFFSLIGSKAPGVIFRYYFIIVMLLLLYFFINGLGQTNLKSMQLQTKTLNPSIREASTCTFWLFCSKNVRFFQKKLSINSSKSTFKSCRCTVYIYWS